MRAEPRTPSAGSRPEAQRVESWRRILSSDGGCPRERARRLLRCLHETPPEAAEQIARAWRRPAR